MQIHEPSKQTACQQSELLNDLTQVDSESLLLVILLTELYVVSLAYYTYNEICRIIWNYMKNSKDAFSLCKTRPYT